LLLQHSGQLLVELRRRAAGLDGPRDGVLVVLLELEEHRYLGVG